MVVTDRNMSSWRIFIEHLVTCDLFIVVFDGYNKLNLD